MSHKKQNNKQNGRQWHYASPPGIIQEIMEAAYLSFHTYALMVIYNIYTTIP